MRCCARRRTAACTRPCCKSAPEVVFNLASIYGWERTNLVPAVLEIAGMRYTGSNLLSLSLARNYTKRFPLLLASGVPMVEFAVMKAGEAAVPAGFDFPLTLYCDGIYDEMTINSRAELEEALKDYPPREDLVLQKMVSGERSSIYILDSAPFLPPENPAYLEPALKAYELLEARGLARFDFIESGSFYLDEIDLSPDPLDKTFLQAAAEHGLNETDILIAAVEACGAGPAVAGQAGLVPAQESKSARRKDHHPAAGVERTGA